MITREVALVNLEFEADAEPNIQEIRQQYKKRALQYHPDINNSNEAGVEFNAINQAYELLTENDSISDATHDEQFLNSLYSHLFALEEKIRCRKPSKSIELTENISWDLQPENKKYLYNCIDAALNIARLLQDYMNVCSESWSLSEIIRKAQLIYALNIELRKFGENGVPEIRDAGTLELVKILLDHLAYLKDPINNFKSTEDKFKLVLLDDVAPIAQNYHQQLLDSHTRFNKKIIAFDEPVEIKLFITDEMDHSQKNSEKEIHVPTVNLDSTSSEEGMELPIELEQDDSENTIVEEKKLAITIVDTPKLRALPPVPKIQLLTEKQALKILDAPIFPPSAFHEYVKSDADIIIGKYEIQLARDRENSFFSIRSNFLDMKNKTLEKIIQHSMTGGTFGFGKNRTWKVIKDDLQWIDEFDNPTAACSDEFRIAWNKAHKDKVVKIMEKEVRRLWHDHNWGNNDIKLAAYLMLIHMINQSDQHESFNELLQKAKDKKLESGFMMLIQTVKQSKLYKSPDESLSAILEKVKVKHENLEIEIKEEVEDIKTMSWIEEEYVETRKTNESGQTNWEKVTRNNTDQITIGDALTWRQFKYGLFSSTSADVWKDLCDTYCNPVEENKIIQKH